jgi:hypothetical protein
MGDATQGRIGWLSRVHRPAVRRPLAREKVVLFRGMRSPSASPHGAADSECVDVDRWQLLGRVLDAIAVVVDVNESNVATPPRGTARPGANA